MVKGTWEDCIGSSWILQLCMGSRTRIQGRWCLGKATQSCQIGRSPRRLPPKRGHKNRLKAWLCLCLRDELLISLQAGDHRHSLYCAPVPLRRRPWPSLTRFRFATHNRALSKAQDNVTWALGFVRCARAGGHICTSQCPSVENEDLHTGGPMENVNRDYSGLRPPDTAERKRAHVLAGQRISWKHHQQANECCLATAVSHNKRSRTCSKGFGWCQEGPLT